MLRAGCHCAPPSLVCDCWGWKRIWGAELPFSATSPGSLDIAVAVCRAPQREGVRVCNTIRGSPLWGRQDSGAVCRQCRLEGSPRGCPCPRAALAVLLRRPSRGAQCGGREQELGACFGKVAVFVFKSQRLVNSTRF